MLETVSAPLLYPGIPMARFGLIPEEYGGGPRYRLIWAPSRMVTLTGRWKTMTVPMYVNTYDQTTGEIITPAIEPIGEQWILEAWKAPHELYRGTKEDWESDQQMLNMGPYPSRGDFVRCETLSCNPSNANIDKLITWIEEGGKRRAIENALYCQRQLKENGIDRKNKRGAITRNSMRPWGAESYAARGGGRNSKTYPLLKSREELGLPAGGASAAMGGRGKLRAPKREIFEVMTR